MYNYLKGDNLLNSSRTFHTVYNHVGGLAPSAPVLINGLTVGRVQSVNFVGDGSGKLKVTLTVDSDFKFSKNSIVELFDNGLLGGKAIQILPAFDNAENAEKGDYLEGSIKGGLTDLIGETVTPLQEKIQTIMVSADSTLTNINSVLDYETKNNLKNAIAELTTTITSFKETSKSLNNLIKNNEEKLSNTITNVEDISSNLSSITDSIASANLNETINGLKSTLNNFDKILASIENGEGTVGKLLKDEALYDNLAGASKQVEELLEDMKLNPKRYVHFSLFGKKAKQYDADGNEIKANNKN